MSSGRRSRPTARDAMARRRAARLAAVLVEEVLVGPGLQRPRDGIDVIHRALRRDASEQAADAVLGLVGGR